ncbi:hypothetical protein HER21_42935, partial [Pseudomonas sp. BGM005]|nr:hypothetical protein [Pseudomonas sp. BG5]
MTYPRSSFGPAADASTSSASQSVAPSPRFPEIERDVLDFWETDQTFRASIEQREG